MNKQDQLNEITEVIRSCLVCKIDKSGLVVPGEGNAFARIVFIGEAPGKTESEVGRPFIGRSGKILRAFIREIGLLEKDVYITNPVKYLPNTGKPTATDILHGREHLIRQLEIINPEIVVLLGTTACQALLQKMVSVKDVHGIIEEKDNRKYFITLHPAAALRFPRFKKMLHDDFLLLQKLL